MENIQPTIVRSKIGLGFKSLVLTRMGVVVEVVNHKRRMQVAKFLRKMREKCGYEFREPQQQVFHAVLKKVRVRTQCPKCDYIRFLRL